MTAAPISTQHQQLLYPVHLLADDDSSGVLWFALLLAVMLHLNLWFISFELPQPRPDQQPGLDVTLVEVPSASEATAPGAQSDLISTVEQMPQATKPQPSTEPPPLEQPRLLTAVESNAQIEQPTPLEPDLPRGTDLFRQGLGDARQLIPQATLAPGELRKKYISASTTDWLYASYMNAWTQKVERVGNMNYPEQALRRNMRGDLVLSVGIRVDGSLESIEVLRDSGYPVLDEAAIRIVELSAPFSALPEQITREVDVLYITRTWRFSPDNRTFN